MPLVAWGGWLGELDQRVLHLRPSSLYVYFEERFVDAWLQYDSYPATSMTGSWLDFVLPPYSLLALNPALLNDVGLYYKREYEVKYRNGVAPYVMMLGQRGIYLSNIWSSQPNGLGTWFSINGYLFIGSRLDQSRHRRHKYMTLPRLLPAFLL